MDGNPAGDPLFAPLTFRNLTVKNRLFRSSISGRIDNYDGSGTPARVNFEERFARGGVGAIISSHVPVHVRGRILPNYAFIDADDKVPFWRRVVERVHQHDCRFILQLSHGGRQQDIAGVENLGRKALSASNRTDSFHGLECQAMTVGEIRDVVGYFAAGARRAREAGCDGIELHSGNGYLFSQFLSSAINDRQDEYGGALENRARFLVEVIRAIRREVGADFHLQAKLNGQDMNDALIPFFERPGNTLEEGIRICQLAVEAGVDAIHVSRGSIFPHPHNPSGGLPMNEVADSYDTMLSSGRYTLRNYALYRSRVLRPAFRWLWDRTRPRDEHGSFINEGGLVEDARAIKRAVPVPVLVTGGFQTGSYIRKILAEGACDAVTIARPLLANPDLPRTLAAGREAERPCTYCNRCLVHVLEDPLGCYDPARFDGDTDAMIAEVMAFYSDPAPWPG